MRNISVLRFLRALLVLSLLSVATIAAQPAHLVKDLETSTVPGTGLGEVSAPFGSGVYFGASSAGSFEQLWTTNGTPGGTRKLRDFDVVGGFPPSRFTATDSALYFFVDRALWKIDRTGDVRHVALLPADAWYAAALPHAVVFTIYTDNRFQLWSSDGTAEGTRRVDAIPPGTFFTGELTRAGDVVYFLARGTTLEVWKTDGTEPGTVRVTALDPHYSDAGWLAALGDLFVFVTSDSGDSSRPFVLVRSDGTAAGTFPLGHFAPMVGGGVCPLYCPLVGPSLLTPADGQLFMIADEGEHGPELWRTDGSVAGTRLVKDIAVGPVLGIPLQSFITVGRNAYFTANDGVHGSEIWVSDGTETGTRLIADLFSGDVNPTAVAALEDRALFLGSDSYDLWVTDGTEAGTLPVRHFDNSDGGLHGFVSVPGAVLFTQRFHTGSILWRTDGTHSGTLVVEAFQIGDGSYPDSLTSVSGRLSFATRGGPAYSGPLRDLWSSDGTDAGTRLVRSFDSMSLTATFRGALFFGADDGEHGFELWKSDGTPGGTELVKDIAPAGSDLTDSYPSYFEPAGAHLFFAASAPGYGMELWATEGTEDGTHLVRDVKPGPEGSDPIFLGAVGERIVFMANDGVHGQELWASDGTPDGTFLVRDILPGEVGCSFQDSVVALGRVFFGAYDGSAFGLWSTDGTTEGTHSLGPFDPHYLTAAGRFIYFRDYSVSKLWRSDGTAEGTFVIRDITALQLAGSTGLLYFLAQDGEHGLELWRSDGTAAGTQMVRDILPGSMSGTVSLAAIADLAVFSANDGEHGVELWSSDGSEAGTRMIQDLSPGATSSNPYGFTLSGGQVYFVANDGTTGDELWAIPVDALRTGPARGLDPAERSRTGAREVPPRP